MYRKLCYKIIWFFSLLLLSEHRYHRWKILRGGIARTDSQSEIGHLVMYPSMNKIWAAHYYFFFSNENKNKFIYYAYIHSKIRYSIEVYGQAIETQIENIHVYQTGHSKYCTTGSLKHLWDNYIKTSIIAV